MNANVVICKNEVLIEGQNIGQFVSFEMSADSQSLGNTATLTIPLYAIGVDGTKGDARSRVREVFKDKIIKVCAHVEVYVWYEGMDKIKAFSGFIERVEEGFPAKLHLMDNAFMLKFGQIQKAWDGTSTVQKILEDIIPIANDAFKKERDSLGLSESIPALKYDTSDTNVQAITSPISMKNWGARSPYNTVQKLMQTLVLYGGVNDKYNVFVGAGVKDSQRPIIDLDTRFNVVEREIVPTDGRFINYNVKVTGLLANGKQYTAVGDSESNTAKTENKKAADPKSGEMYRSYSMLNTESGIKDQANRLLQKLKGIRNAGTITCLLYPKLDIMDWVKYNDTVFKEVSGGYYVRGYKLNASEQGYFQQIEVTDQIYAL